MKDHPATHQLLRLDQLASALDLPRSVLADVPPVRPARGRYMALYSLTAARQHLSERGNALDRLGAVLAG